MIYDLVIPADCPEPSAGPYAGTAYRVVGRNPPTSGDLLTYLELQRLPRANLCKRASLSLYATRRQAQHRLDVSPHLGRFVAAVTLTPAHGKVSEPGAFGHMSWWPYKGMRNPDHFEVTQP